MRSDMCWWEATIDGGRAGRHLGVSAPRRSRSPAFRALRSTESPSRLRPSSSGTRSCRPCSPLASDGQCVSARRASRCAELCANAHVLHPAQRHQRLQMNKPHRQRPFRKHSRHPRTLISFLQRCSRQPEWPAERIRLPLADESPAICPRSSGIKGILTCGEWDAYILFATLP